MSLEFKDLDPENYSLDMFSVICNQLVSDPNTCSNFIRFALTGAYNGINSHQAILDPIQNALNDHPISVVQDCNSLLGLSVNIVFNKPITIYPAAEFKDTLSKNIHLCLQVQPYGPKKSIGPNWTGLWSSLFFSCGCPNLALFQLLVASFQKSFKTIQRLAEISCNRLNGHVHYIAL